MLIILLRVIIYAMKYWKHYEQLSQQGGLIVLQGDVTPTKGVFCWKSNLFSIRKSLQSLTQGKIIVFSFLAEFDKSEINPVYICS